MPAIPAPSVPVSQVGRAAHDVGLAGLLGGNLFGRLALHPSVTQISAEAAADQTAPLRLQRTIEGLLAT